MHKARKVSQAPLDSLAETADLVTAVAQAEMARKVPPAPTAFPVKTVFQALAVFPVNQATLARTAAQVTLESKSPENQAEPAPQALEALPVSKATPVLQA